MSDVEIVGPKSGTFTYLSDSHGSTSWFDHVLCAYGAHVITGKFTNYHDIISSDHFPLAFDKEQILVDKSSPIVLSTGVKQQKEVSSYHALTDKLLGDIVFSSNHFIYCETCEDGHHCVGIED